MVSNWFFTSLDSLAAGLTDWRKCMCFSYVSIIIHFLPAMLAHGPSILLDTIRIGHETI